MLLFFSFLHSFLEQRDRELKNVDMDEIQLRREIETLCLFGDKLSHEGGMKSLSNNS